VEQAERGWRHDLRKEYPGATFTQIVAITAVRDGKDALEGYEIVLKTADGGDAEIIVAPDGKVLERA
jgi:hypothetical protein